MILYFVTRQMIVPGYSSTAHDSWNGPLLPSPCVPEQPEIWDWLCPAACPWNLSPCLRCLRFLIKRFWTGDRIDGFIGTVLFEGSDRGSFLESLSGSAHISLDWSTLGDAALRSLHFSFPCRKLTQTQPFLGLLIKHILCYTHCFNCSQYVL